MSEPSLRFPEFSDKWCTKKLEEISEHISYGLTVRPEYINEGIPLISAREIKDGVIDYKNAPRISQDSFDKLSNKAMAKKGDIFLSKTGTIGLVAYVSSDLPIAITQNIAIIRILDKTYSHPFILQSLKTSKFYKSAIDKVNQSTIMDLQLQDIRKLSLDLPTLPEQTKIANFLTAVDEKISQLNQKHDLLSQYKNGVMQQIFSQELRFQDDDGGDFPEWEESTLGEVCDIKRGASPRPIADKKWFSDDSAIGWVRISDVSKSSKYLTKTEQYLSEAGVRKSRLVKKGNIIMSICATIGKPIYTNFDVCIHDGFVVFENLQIGHEYLYYYLMLIEKNWYKYGQPGSQVNLNSDIVSNETIPIPDIKEQTKIANFLTAIDYKITATQAELNAVKQYKQGLLQQMFV
jgi:type I restriction enzyme S subunit